jgi:hypothetical protein
MNKVDVPNDTLPCTGYKCDIIVNFDEKGSVWDLNTHVFHESTKANLYQKISILQKYYHRQTISTFHHSAIREQRCGFSTDLEEKATF